MTNDPEYVDVDLTFNEADAQNFARIVKLRSSADAENFFRVMKNVVKVFIKLLYAEQQEELHDSRKELAKVSKVLAEAVSILTNMSKRSKEIMIFEATIDNEIASGALDLNANPLTAELTLSSSSGATLHAMDEPPNSTGPHILILQERAGKIIKPGDHLFEANIATIQQTRAWADSGLRRGLRPKPRRRKFAMTKAIIMLEFYYKLFTGRKATRANRTDRTGRQVPYGPFIELAEAVFRRVLPEEWRNKRLDSLIRDVLYPEDRKKRRERQKKRNARRKFKRVNHKIT
jgi:hypothetical protein